MSKRHIEVTIETEEALVIRRRGDASHAFLRALHQHAEAERLRLDDHEARIDRIVSELAALRALIARHVDAHLPSQETPDK